MALVKVEGCHAEMIFWLFREEKEKNTKTNRKRSIIK